MSLRKQHLGRHCLLFTFLREKRAAEAQKTICAVLRKNDVSHSTCRKSFKPFEMEYFELHDDESPRQSKKIEDEELYCPSVNNFW